LLWIAPPLHILTWFTVPTGTSPHFRTDSPTSNCCSRGTLPHFGLQGRVTLLLQKASLEYLLLSPRSTLEAASHEFTPEVHCFFTGLYALLLTQAQFLTRLLVLCGISGALKRHPFSESLNSAGELLHTP